MLLEGIFLPVTTPFHADGRLSLSKLSTNLARYSLTPAAGIVVLGESGEPDALSDAETGQILIEAARAVAAEKVLLAAIARESVYATLRFASIAADARYDAIVLRAPLCTAAASAHPELVTYFRTIADRATLPIVLESSPGRPLSVALIRELAQHPNIPGLIDADAVPSRLAAIRAATAGITRNVTVTTIFAAATGRMLRTTAPDGLVSVDSLAAGTASAVEGRPAIKTRTRRVGFQILTGSTTAMLESWQAGASGAVPRLAAAAPQACCEVWQACRDGDQPLAAEKQERLLAAAALVDPIGVLKYACDLNAYFGGHPRLPQLPPNAAAREQIAQALKGMRN